ncbi:EamA family transporter [Tumebacillus sp. DT12]|uniref:EamA family transporter n=2 Tax=Tumebacillus lacus TaxID=2995335 RepID=A0ABT3WZF5_9BACL|nr:EamA family transporter [Tumebacillus lacus]
MNPAAKNRLIGGLCLGGAAAIWGGMYVVSKYVLDYIPPLTLVVLRFAVAALVLGLVVWVKGGWRVERSDWGALARYALVGYTISISAQFIGTKLSSAHMGAVLTSASPAFIALFAWLLLRERLTLRKLLSLAVATVGVLIVVGTDQGDPSGGGSVLWGNLALVIAAVTWALYSVLGKSLSDKYPALTVTFWAAVAGAVFTLPVAGWEMTTEEIIWTADPLVWGGVLFLGIVSTALAFFLWLKGFELMDAGTAGLFFFVQPIVGTLLGWLLLGEHLTLAFLLGSALIIGSVAVSMKQAQET